MPFVCINQDSYVAFNLEPFPPAQHLPGINCRRLDGLGFSAGANGNRDRQPGNRVKQHGNRGKQLGNRGS